MYGDIELKFDITTSPNLDWSGADSELFGQLQELADPIEIQDDALIQKLKEKAVARINAVYFNAAGSTVYWPQKILYFQKKHDQILDNEKIEQRRLLSDRMEKYEAVLTTFEYDVKALERNSSLYPEHVAATNEKLKNFRNRLEEVTIESESINDLQLCLVKGSSPTDYSTRLETLDTDLEPFEKLWGNVAKFLNLMKVWRESPLASISPGTVESELDGLRRIMQKMQRTFRAS